ncbi:hypothetical protein HID58_096233 [Brassica napus]|uniref:Methyltransferase type 11 domain-containing protein n=1 Tax=Brassica napus TaxID=3708 RepID=A0ABQ7X145_BRANA|nr:hypothetical protein HID58_096233 [Brassica napus]
MPLSTEIFRTPLVLPLREGLASELHMGWFSGPEKEPVFGGNIIDASCGSGMFSGLFARSELFLGKVVLVRADIARLPFLSGSVDAVHAGAALHCWPSPSSAELMRYSGSHIFLSERELEDLCKAGGLVGFTRVRNGLFIMLSATKPSR